MWLFVLFVTVPIIEIALFIQIGGEIGLLSALGIVIANRVSALYHSSKTTLKLSKTQSRLWRMAS